RLLSAVLLLTAAGCQNHAVPVSLYVEGAAAADLDFWHFSGANGNYLLPEITGSGVALIDFDTDGDLDVFFLQGELLDTKGTTGDVLRPPPAGWAPGNRLYRNEIVPTGVLSFIDVSSDAGDLGGGYGMGAAVGDFDNDGDPDLYVTGLGDNYLLRNDGGKFNDVTASLGAVDERWNVGATFLDFDVDGDLDLFVSAYVAQPLTKNRECKNPAGQRDYCSPSNFDGLADRLFRNDGEQGFVDVSDESGIGGVTGAGLGVIAADFDQDDRIDIYVANDQTANHLWLNKGGGIFAESALIAGAAYNSDGRAEASMGVTAADYDMDGDLDLFMTHLSTESNTLYRNNGRGNFFDATDNMDLAAGSIRYTGWGTKWLDANHDGVLDLFVANGAVMSGVADSDHHPYAQRNQLFIATGQGYEQDAVPGSAQNSRGAAFGDIDNDGDLDIVISNNDGPAQLYLNQPDPRRHWLSVRLGGTTDNRDALGARVALLRADQNPVWGRVAREGSYAAASDPRVHFGLGELGGTVAVAVVWPDGRREIWRGVTTDQRIELTQGEGEAWGSAE
ncbi:MAG: CRTAC1 family protein, partial [Gammaproteobacteria bacterium]|nr:CRTAC1 family protein [Gammaproteobacteria bacterium]